MKNTKGGWVDTTTAVKEALGIKCLTKEGASALMALYLKSTPVEKMIEILGGKK